MSHIWFCMFLIVHKEGVGANRMQYEKVCCIFLAWRRWPHQAREFESAPRYRIRQFKRYHTQQLQVSQAGKPGMFHTDGAEYCRVEVLKDITKFMPKRSKTNMDERKPLDERRITLSQASDSIVQRPRRLPIIWRPIARTRPSPHAAQPDPRSTTSCQSPLHTPQTTSPPQYEYGSLRRRDPCPPSPSDMRRETRVHHADVTMR